MPFPDELARDLAVHDCDPRWPAEFATLRATLSDALGDRALAIDHIGSTSVPGLPAKDRVDIQIRVSTVEESVFAPIFASPPDRLDADLIRPRRVP